MSFVYLASPYTPTAGESVNERADAAKRYAAKLMSDGHVVFSPIAHSHHVADHLPAHLRVDHDFWMEQDMPLLRAAGRLVVLMLPGWERSRGVAQEIQEATRMNIPVEYAEP
jgi:hypothetical protein